ncbi:MAG: hypothetical protein KJO84_05685 [Acidimicrobiia bacterium]|nr:hypothetical protein [Acidimicrobiia bacterium]
MLVDLDVVQLEPEAAGLPPHADERSRWPSRRPKDSGDAVVEIAEGARRSAVVLAPLLVPLAVVVVAVVVPVCVVLVPTVMVVMAVIVAVFVLPLLLMALFVPLLVPLFVLGLVVVVVVMRVLFVVVVVPLAPTPTARARAGTPWAVAVHSAATPPPTTPASPTSPPPSPTPSGEEPIQNGPDHEHPEQVAAGQTHPELGKTTDVTSEKVQDHRGFSGRGHRIGRSYTTSPRIGRFPTRYLGAPPPPTAAPRDRIQFGRSR